MKKLNTWTVVATALMFSITLTVSGALAQEQPVSKPTPLPLCCGAPEQTASAQGAEKGTAGAEAKETTAKPSCCSQAAKPACCAQAAAEESKGYRGGKQKAASATTKAAKGKKAQVARAAVKPAGSTK